MISKLTSCHNDFVDFLSETDKCRTSCVTKNCGCNSSGTHPCNVNNASSITKVVLLQDFSGKCRQGKTFGSIADSAWTSSGCKGQFWICFDHKGDINPTGPVTEPTTVPETTSTTTLRPIETEPDGFFMPTITTQRPPQTDTTPFDYSDPDGLFGR